MTIDRALAFLILMSAIAAGCAGTGDGASLHPRGRQCELR